MMARAVGTHFQNGLLYLQQGLRESSARTATVGDGPPGRRGRRGNAPGQFSLLMPHFSRTPPLTRSFLLLRFGPSVLRSVRPSVRPRPTDEERRLSGIHTEERRFFLSRRLSACVRVPAPSVARRPSAGQHRRCSRRTGQAAAAAASAA